jgi:hypothetical protein
VVTRLIHGFRVCALPFALALTLIAANVAFAAEIRIGGIDVETQYTGFVGSPTDAGVLTFNDQDNGYADAAPGLVTTSDISALLNADVNFEVALDTSSFNPASGDVRNAVYVGTADNMADIAILSGNTALLTFDVHFLATSQAAHSGSLLGRPDGRIVLGSWLSEQFGVSSNLTVAGGTLNALVGGPGTPAVMEVLMSSLAPEMNRTLRDSGYLNSDFTNGVGTSAESTTWNITIIPEPSTAVLLGFALLGVLAVARRRPSP